jgi:nucleotide-binding universal stress UspA family protein
MKTGKEIKEKIRRFWRDNMYKKILVPLDGSQLAECTLEQVKEIAAGCGAAQVVLLTVTESIHMVGGPWMSSQEQVTHEVAEENSKREMIKGKAKDYLAKVSGNLTKAGLAVQTEVIEDELTQHPAEVILDYADKNDVDLIVIATHGRSGVSRWAFGSVAERVVRHAKVPVLSVTPSGCRIG